MGIYEPVSQVPRVMFTYQTFDMLAHCPPEVMLAVAAWAKWARDKKPDPSKEPATPDFDPICKNLYEIAIDEIRENYKKFWDSCEQNKANRAVDRSSTGGRPNKEMNERREKRMNEKKNDVDYYDSDSMHKEESSEKSNRDRQIIDAAMSAGLPHSESVLIEVREWADQYGMDKLLAAIDKTPMSAQRPTWRYVKAILDQKGADQRKPDYSFLQEVRV